MTKDISSKNTFVENVCHVWAGYHYKKPVNNFEEQTIWNNTHIRINNAVVFDKTIFDRNVLYVRNVLVSTKLIVKLSLGNSAWFKQFHSGGSIKQCLITCELKTKSFSQTFKCRSYLK